MKDKAFFYYSPTIKRYVCFNLTSKDIKKYPRGFSLLKKEAIMLLEREAGVLEDKNIIGIEIDWRNKEITFL